MAGARSIPRSSANVPSSWSGLNEHLLARFFLWDLEKGVAVPDGGEVAAPITDANMEMTLNWQSPFESSGPESKLPSLMAMLQSGALTPTLQAIQQISLPDAADSFVPDALQRATSSVVGGAANAMKDIAAKAVGRTGITKLNSRQVFSGMPPVRFTLTAHFRALHDPVKEILVPLERLYGWGAPQSLSKDGLVVNAANGGRGDTAIDRIVDVLFPSEVPMVIGMIYGGNSYAPLVIESISRPLDVERDKYGNELALSVQINLATLTAIDKADVARIFQKG